MPTYTYILLDPSGKKIKGEINAENYTSALDLLKKQNKIIFSLKEKKTFLFKKIKVSSKDLAIFFRQLATLINSGISLVRSLENLKKQTRNPLLKKACASIQKSISLGLGFSESLAKHPDIFSDFCINMVRAGETSGALDITLERLAFYFEEGNRLINQVKSALTYPILVISFIILIITGLFVKVIPTFKQIFETLDVPLPLPTQIFLKISDIIRASIIYVVIGVIIFFILFRRYIKTPQGRLHFDKFKLNLFGLKDFLMKIYSANFSRNLSVMLKSGLPILVALEITLKVIGNKFLEKKLEVVKEDVKRGEKLVTALERTGFFSPLVLDLIAVGEETGRLDAMLDKIANFYEEEVLTTLKTLTSLLEPAVIIFLGIAVGSIVISLFLPILKITQVIGGVK